MSERERQVEAEATMALLSSMRYPSTLALYYDIDSGETFQHRQALRDGHRRIR
jgi:hypothetical protein